MIVALLLMLTVQDSFGILNVALIYLLFCFVTSLNAGAGPAVLAALVSFLLFDVLCNPPYDSFFVGRADHVLALFVLLLIAIVTSQLVSRVRARYRMAPQLLVLPVPAGGNAIFSISQSLLLTRLSVPRSVRQI